MKTPYWLAENGYIPDSENPLHFTNPNGHPFHPVTFTRDRQHNQGECLEAMLEAAHAAGFTKGAQQSWATRQLDAPPLPAPNEDTRLLEWLIASGYAPAEWRTATIQELRAGLDRGNGMVLVGPCTRETIRAAMRRGQRSR